MRNTLLFLGLIFIGTIFYAAHTYANTQNDLGALYNEWKEEFVTHEGAGGHARVLQNKDRQTTVSEGQGYGMLLAIYNNDPETFDKLWKYTKQYLNDRGLMHWQIDKTGVVIGRNGATDGDEDIAFALLAAYKQWGMYEEDARAYIDAIFTHEVEAETYVLKPGDVWGGSRITNPSYCAPAYYREFAEFTGEENWLRVLDTCYSIIKKARNINTGLLPEWTTIDGGIAYDLTHNKNRDNFSYNAIRVPWRISVDWVWNRDPRAYSINDRMTNFFDNERKLYSGYTLSGKPIVTYFDATFAAGIAAGSLASDNTKFREEMTERLIQTTSNSYYGATLRLLSLMLVMEKFPNLAIAPAAPPENEEEHSTTTPEVIPSAPQEQEIIPDSDSVETEPIPQEDPAGEEANVGSTTPEILPPEELEVPEIETPVIVEPEENHTIIIDSPEDSATLSGEKKIKAYIENLSLDSYTMIYSVDDNMEDHMHDAAGMFKQAKIQFDSWTWNESGPYRVDITAYDLSGNTLATTHIEIYVKH